ncbi:MAG: exodeoxyribonuclease VII small subunit [Myxococcota bacterium]
MAREKPAGAGQYGQVVKRLQQIVEALEGGELSLEESLERFAEGIALVKQGEKLLADAEKRIEQLVSEDGRAAPLKVPEASEAPAAPPPPRGAAKRPVLPPAEDDDVPF